MFIIKYLAGLFLFACACAMDSSNSIVSLPQNPLQDIQKGQRQSGNRYCAWYSSLGISMIHDTPAAALIMRPDQQKSVMQFMFPVPNFDIVNASTFQPGDTYRETRKQLEDALQTPIEVPVGELAPLNPQWVLSLTLGYSRFYKILTDIVALQDFYPVFGKGSWGATSIVINNHQACCDVVYFPITGRFGFSLRELVQTELSTATLLHDYLASNPCGTISIVGEGGHAVAFLKQALPDNGYQWIYYDCGNSMDQKIASADGLSWIQSSIWPRVSPSSSCLYCFPPK
jgi:hypothetical protein